jgi:hypothetical protein
MDRATKPLQIKRWSSIMMMDGVMEGGAHG